MLPVSLSAEDTNEMWCGPLLFAIQRVTDGLNYLQAFLSVRKWLFLVVALITGPSLSTPPPVFPPILHLLLFTATLKTQAVVFPPTTLARELLV